MLRTVTARLTVLYALLFSLLSLTIFVLLYLHLAASLGGQMDERLKDSAREFTELYRTGGIRALGGEFGREGGAQGSRRVFFRLLDSHGRTLVSSDLKDWPDLARRPAWPESYRGDRTLLQNLIVSRHHHRVRTILQPTGDGHVLQLGISREEDDRLLERYRETFGHSFAVIVLCGALVGFVISRRAMSGVERVRQTALMIGEGDLTHRVPLGREGEEIDLLAKAFNDMLERIDALVGELKEVTNNVAHDLRSPITRIRGIAEMALTGPQDPTEYRDMAGQVVEESDRLVAMINTMLEIAETDAGLAALDRTSVDLGDIVREAAELFQPAAEDLGIDLSTQAPQTPVRVLGDKTRLRRVVANLLDNAIKFTPSGGHVRIALANDGKTAALSVSDTGTGIAPEDLPRIFDRFYRGDRSRSLPGNGLGLSLVRTLVRAHGGDVAVTSRPGAGSTFTVTLPLADST